MYCHFMVRTRGATGLKWFTRVSCEKPAESRTDFCEEPFSGPSMDNRASAGKLFASANGIPIFGSFA